jgi:hypothetical protein
MAGVIEEQRPHQAPELARPLRLAQPGLVLDERLDLLDQAGRKGAQRAPVGHPVGIDALVARLEAVVETEGIGTLLGGELLGHQEREEEGVLGHDVGREPSVRPGMSSRVVVPFAGQDHRLLERPLDLAVVSPQVRVHRSVGAHGTPSTGLGNAAHRIEPRGSINSS